MTMNLSLINWDTIFLGLKWNNRGHNLPLPSNSCFSCFLALLLKSRSLSWLPTEATLAASPLLRPLRVARTSLLWKCLSTGLAPHRLLSILLWMSFVALSSSRVDETALLRSDLVARDCSVPQGDWRMDSDRNGLVWCIPAMSVSWVPLWNRENKTH